MPTFNERDNISKLVEAVFGLYPEIRMLVVDDHSPDGTSGVVRGMQNQYPGLMLLERMSNPGFGCSYRDGFRQVLSSMRCKAVVMMDSDFSHDPAAIRHLLAALAGHDVAIGSRYISGGSVENWSRRRRVLSRGANFYVKLVLNLPMRDATAGFVCLRRKALESIPWCDSGSEGYAFLVELKYLLRRSRLRITEFPITFEERREGQSKMSAVKIWESVLLPWKIRLAHARPANAMRVAETQR